MLGASGTGAAYFDSVHGNLRNSVAESRKLSVNYSPRDYLPRTSNRFGEIWSVCSADGAPSSTTRGRRFGSKRISASPSVLVTEGSGVRC